MRKISIIGHFGFNYDLANGQTIKTKEIADELEKEFGKRNVKRFDTHGGFAKAICIPFYCLSSLMNSKNVIVLPAYRGIKVIIPVISFINLFFNRNIHYCVIGGWLPSMVASKRFFASTIKRFKGIYVETISMKTMMEGLGFNNVYYMPNFKKLSSLAENELVYNNCEPYRLCTFSRIMKEKGIEDAISAVTILNDKYGRIVYTLDIFGQVDSCQRSWFEGIEKFFPSYIVYRGSVPFDKSVETLKYYDALLFPTYYEGEGFAGTILDAMSSGIPVIASDWKYNNEIINENNGLLCLPNNPQDLAEKIEALQKLNLKEKCLRESKKYLPKAVLSVLIDQLG